MSKSYDASTPFAGRFKRYNSTPASGSSLSQQTKKIREVPRGVLHTSIIRSCGPPRSAGWRRAVPDTLLQSGAHPSDSTPNQREQRQHQHGGADPRYRADGGGAASVALGKDRRYLPSRAFRLPSHVQLNYNEMGLHCPLSLFDRIGPSALTRDGRFLSLSRWLVTSRSCQTLKLCRPRLFCRDFRLPTTTHNRACQYHLAAAAAEMRAGPFCS